MLFRSHHRLSRACITSHGKLANTWSYISRLRELQRQTLNGVHPNNTVIEIELRVREII